MAANVGDNIPEELIFFTSLINEWGWHVDKSACHHRSNRNNGGGFVFVVKGFGYRRQVIFQNMDVIVAHPINKYDLADPECFSKIRENFNEFVENTGGTIGPRRDS